MRIVLSFPFIQFLPYYHSQKPGVKTRDGGVLRKPGTAASTATVNDRFPIFATEMFRKRERTRERGGRGNGR